MNRQKRLEITGAMLEQIQRVTGTTVSARDIVVYEAAALSTRPLTKVGSIYHGARPTREMLVAMEQALLSGEQSVPLHTLHMQGAELPVGRVFAARVEDEWDGSSVLVAQFYLPTTEEELISKIDLAVLDEVSVGVMAKKAVCSKCGFDYFSEEASFENLWDQTCPNGHTIGLDGTHLVMSGLNYWSELSLVSRGAANQPKIRARAMETMPKSTYERLAASANHKTVEAMLLTTTSPMEKPLSAEKLEALQASVAALTELVTPLNRLPALEAQALEATQKLATAEAELADTAARLAAAEAQVAELTEKLAAQTTEVTPPTNLPIGGVAASATSGGIHLAAAATAVSAFKTQPTRR